MATNRRFFVCLYDSAEVNTKPANDEGWMFTVKQVLLPRLLSSHSETQDAIGSAFSTLSSPSHSPLKPA
jgi:hypothetical protein